MSFNDTEFHNTSQMTPDKRLLKMVQIPLVMCATILLPEHFYLHRYNSLTQPSCPTPHQLQPHPTTKDQNVFSRVDQDVFLLSERLGFDKIFCDIYQPAIQHHIQLFV